MSANPKPDLVLPLLRELLDDQFEPRELGRVLGFEEQGALDLAHRVLHGPLADLLARPGKEIRARLVEHAFAVARVSAPCACAHLPAELPYLVEMLHAGSLVIDDIEDDAETRRGAPALHRTWGLPVALNAGNWLYFWPLVVLSGLRLDRNTALALHRRMAITLLRCHQGQALDLSLVVDELPQSSVRAAVAATTRLKTGSLLELSCAMGAITAHAPPHIERALASFGREVGVALQMLDDLGSLISPARREKAHEDLIGARPTWPWAWLSEELDEPSFAALRRAASDARSRRSSEALLTALRARLGPSHRRRPREHLNDALTELSAAVGSSPALASLERDVRSLEHAYA